MNVRDELNDFYLDLARRRVLRQAEPVEKPGMYETGVDFAKAFVVLLMWVAALYLIVIAVAIS